MTTQSLRDRILAAVVDGDALDDALVQAITESEQAQAYVVALAGRLSALAGDRLHDCQRRLDDLLDAVTLLASEQPSGKVAPTVDRAVYVPEPKE